MGRLTADDRSLIWNLRTQKGWGSKNPDLNPVDYTVWDTLQQTVYRRRRFTSVEQLQRAIITECGKLSRRFIVRAIGQWRRLLECVVQQPGGHIEHMI